MRLPLNGGGFALHQAGERSQSQLRAQPNAKSPEADGDGVGKSQRDCGLQPKVARNELPWVTILKAIQPQRGCGKPLDGGVSIPKVFLIPSRHDGWQ